MKRYFSIIALCVMALGETVTAQSLLTPEQLAKREKKKNLTVKRLAAIQIKKAKGKLTYKKLKGNKKITVAKSGTMTAKKDLKKNTYSVRVKVTAAGNSNYKSLSKTVTIKVKVR